MANASVILTKVRFLDNDLNEVFFDDFDTSDTFHSFIETMSKFSFEIDGSYMGNQYFSLCGRWDFRGNFDWSYEVEHLCEEVISLDEKIQYIHFFYREYETGFDFLNESVLVLNVHSQQYDHEVLENFQLSTFAQENGVDFSNVENMTENELEEHWDKVTEVADEYCDALLSMTFANINLFPSEQQVNGEVEL